MICLKVGENDANQRLNRFIEKVFPKFPRSAIYKAIRIKKIKVNGKRSRADEILKLGDKVKIFGFSEFVRKTRSSKVLSFSLKGKIKIVYEDENLIIVNKPAGLNSQPCKNGSDSLISRILNYMVSSNQLVLENENSFLPAICNRLDRNTSGLVVAAKNFNALKSFNELLKSRRILKIYCCLSEGVFDEENGVLVNWLTKDFKKNKALVSELKIRNSKLSVLRYFVVKQFLNYAKLRVVLYTGRFHQIRAQLSFIGHPILGDLKYGSLIKNRKMSLQAVGLIFNTKNSMFDYLDGREIEIDSII